MTFKVLTGSEGLHLNPIKPVILCVIGEKANIKLFENLLIPKGYLVVNAASGKVALLEIRSHAIDLVLLDIIKLGMDNFEVRPLESRGRGTPGPGPQGFARQEQRGLFHTKKVCIRDSAGTTKYLLGISEDITERKQSEKILQETLESLKKAFGTIVQVMSSAVEAKNTYTAGHQLRVTDLACAIGTEMGLVKDKIEGILVAACTDCLPTS